MRRSGIWAIGALVILSSVAHAALIDRGGGLIYDSVLNVTWLQDANFAKTSGYDADGLMTWGQATAWASNLVYYDSVRGTSYSDWRLPQTRPVSGLGWFNLSIKNDGSSDFGFNISAPGSAYPGSKGSEMANVFYSSLGNKSPYFPDGGSNQPGWGLNHRGPFINLQEFDYWSGTFYDPGPDGESWYFFFQTGEQGTFYNLRNAYAWAVRDGDVASVPEPAAMCLLGSGLIGLGMVVKLKSRLRGR